MQINHFSVFCPSSIQSYICMLLLKDFQTKIKVEKEIKEKQKEINKKETKRNKPWIALGLQKSIFIRNHLLTKYIKLKGAAFKMKFKLNRNNIEIYCLL